MIKESTYKEWKPCFIYNERRFDVVANGRGKGNYIVSNERAEKKEIFTPYGAVYLIRVKFGDTYLYHYDF